MSRRPAPDAGAATRSGWRDVALVTLLALLARLSYFFVSSRTNPAFDYLIMDSMHIDAWGRALAAGEAEPAVFFRGPLYPYFLAQLYRLTDGGVAAALVANHVMGAITCGLVVWLGREYFARAVSLTAGLVTAFYWPLIYFEGEILVEPMFLMLVVLALWTLARAAARPAPLRLILAGIALGLAALTRPTILAAVVLLPVVFRYAGGAKERRSWLRGGVQPAAIVTLLCALVLVPATLHNYRAGGAIVPVAWSGGLNFYIGNNPQSDGRSAFIPDARGEWMGGDAEALAIASAQAGRELSPAEASSFYLRRGLDYLATDPAGALGLTLRKLYGFWEGQERSNEKYMYFFWDRYGLGRVPMPGFWLVAPLALVGMARLWPRRRELSLLYGFVAVYMLAVVAFFVVARFRLPVVPVLVLFASALVVEWVARVRARDRRGLAAALAGFAAALVFVNAGYPRFLSTRAAHDMMAHYTLAGALVEEKNMNAATIELHRAKLAFERAPSDQYAGIAQDVYFKLGTLLYERGRCKEATDALGKVLPDEPRAGAARAMFADCCERTGRFAEAARAYEIVLLSEPGNARALEGLVRCLEALGRYDDAARAREHFGSP